MSWRYFDLSEFDCSHCGENKMEPRFIDRLDDLRHRCGFPLRVTSGYRCPEHNQAVSTTGPSGPHTTGWAVDFGISHQDAHTLLTYATDMGFAGIGINQKGGGRFIHLDDLLPPNHSPRPHIWSY